MDTTSSEPLIEIEISEIIIATAKERFCNDPKDVWSTFLSRIWVSIGSSGAGSKEAAF